MSNLRAYRRERGIRQEDLAASVGVEQATISRLEAGLIRPSLDLAFAIERVTNGQVPACSWVNNFPNSEAS